MQLIKTIDKISEKPTFIPHIAIIRPSPRPMCEGDISPRRNNNKPGKIEKNILAGEVCDNSCKIIPAEKKIPQQISDIFLDLISLIVQIIRNISVHIINKTFIITSVLKFSI